MTEVFSFIKLILGSFISTIVMSFILFEKRYSAINIPIGPPPKINAFLGTPAVKHLNDLSTPLIAHAKGSAKQAISEDILVYFAIGPPFNTCSFKIMY